MANPILGPVPGALPTNMVIAASPTRLLLLKICRYSPARVNLNCLGNDSPICFPTISKAFIYGVSRALPLALRALITLRPPRVCIRARNPCVLARFILLGWNVRFMSKASNGLACLNLQGATMYWSSHLTSILNALFLDNFCQISCNHTPVVTVFARQRNFLHDQPLLSLWISILLNPVAPAC